MKKLVGFILITLTFSSVSLYVLTYKGERRFSELNNLPDVNLVIQNSRSLSYTPYDPLMGMYENIGGRLGFIVCSDIPNIAYGMAGYSLETLLQESYKKNPSSYDSSNGNNPNNPFFHRRARNLYSYFQSIQSLKPITYQPSSGDLAFYRKTPNGYIAHVALITEADGNSYKLMESAPKTILAQEVDKLSLIKRGWILAGFGKVY